MILPGYCLNTLILLALMLAVGFVVDDSVVMLENINRHLDQGAPAMQVALDGNPNQYEAILELSPQYQTDINALSTLSMVGTGRTTRFSPAP